MKTKHLFPCLGVVLCEAWARRGIASVRSRILPALIAVLNLLQAGRATAQTFTTLHSFAADYNFYSSDGELLGFANSDGLRRQEHRHQSHHPQPAVLPAHPI